MKGLLNQWIDKRISSINESNTELYKTPQQPKPSTNRVKLEQTSITPRGSIMARRESAFTDVLPMPVKQRNTPSHLSTNSPQKEQLVSGRRKLGLDPDNPFNRELSERQLGRSRSHNKKHFVVCDNKGNQDGIPHFQHPCRALEARVLDSAL